MANPRPHATDHPIDATEFAALPREGPTGSNSCAGAWYVPPAPASSTAGYYSASPGSWMTSWRQVATVSWW